MPRRSRLAALVGSGALLLAGAAVAVALTGADAAKDRITHMKGMGAAAKAIGDQLKSGAPDPAIVKLNAAKIATSAPQIPTWFPAGSGVEAYPKSEALAVVWSNPTGFTTKQHALVEAADKLNAVAQAGDMSALGPVMQGVGAACKGCHQTFKAKDKD